MRTIFRTMCVILLGVTSLSAQEPIRLAKSPALSPDGSLLAFEWNGDLWLARSDGGEARQLTTHPARDASPRFSPDGKQLAFLSDREGAFQVFTIPTSGGTPKQMTSHTAGFDQVDYFPDGKSLLVRAARDNFWRHAERFVRISLTGPASEHLIFDDYGSDGQLSPDGTKMLFTREGEGWWRKGYKGARVAQVWLYDLAQKSFTKLLHQEFGSRWPLWKPDGQEFYFVQENAKGANLAEYDFRSKETRLLTNFASDSVVFPAMARDGSLLVFRHLFDLYTYKPATREIKKLDIYHNTDRVSKKLDQRLLTLASDVAFTNDGLEIAFTAGGSLWVMDTELREPKLILGNAYAAAQPLFTSDGQTILCVEAMGEQHVVWKVTRGDAKQFWWQNKSFVTEKLAEFKEPISRLRPSPDGKKLAYVLGNGDLWVSDLDMKNAKKVLAGWNTPEFDWSPDGKWFVYASFDDDFNRDIWIMPSDGGKTFNLSRHPFNESHPVWSPDGKMVAFAGQRASTESESNICLVWLRAEDDEKTARDRKLDKALEKMKGRTPPAKSPAKTDAPEEKKDAKDEVKEGPKKMTPITVVIDFEGIAERVQRISLGDGSANALFWSPDSKKLAFTGSYDNKPGTFALDIGESSTPKPLTATVGMYPVWLKQGNQIVWLVAGVPTSTPATGAATAAPTAPTPVASKAPLPGLAKTATPAAAPATGGSYTFSVRQKIDQAVRHQAVFDACWRTMRDHWYDAKHNNNDWTKVLTKYREMATQAPDLDTVVTVIQLMLGELNGSHLGFTPNPADFAGKAAAPRDTTPHLGVRFDPAFAGPGLKIRDVLPKGPADQPRSRLRPGEIILMIDGQAVGNDTPLSLFNGPLDREMILKVAGLDGKERTVSLRPITYAAAQILLYEHWLNHNRKFVDEASQGKLGYLHISQMSMPTFRKFEEELVSQGSGKEGLVIDVRENPGGSTADHLLTALTQPVHAITVPRGGGQGYPQDRKIYTTWNKPIVVLCNQNSGSNAEIFSHAIKTLKRGQVVGIPTAGAVVSTGAVPIMDVGLLRLPFRGWFLVDDGKDMEKNGAVPHHVLWPAPASMPTGQDAQLNKAIEVLQADVQAWRDRPRPKLKYSTE